MTRVLLNWYYTRADLTDYLLKLSDEFEIVFLDKFSPDEEDASSVKLLGAATIRYWNEFRSPYQLLKEVGPAIILFYDIEAFNQVALNVAAKNLGIPTLVLQHGVRGDYEIAEALSQSRKQSIRVSSSTSWTLKFLFRSLRPNNLPNLPSILKFVVNRKRYELTVALTRSQAEWRNANYYIELSRNNTGYHKKRDGVGDEQFFIIGNPQFDEYFHYLNSPGDEVDSNCALLIDAPFCEASLLTEKRMSVEEKNNYIQNINQWCLTKGLRLIVKLHPLSYSVGYLVQHENIVYERAVFIGGLVKRSALVFFVHFSSLTPLIMHYRPFVYFSNEYLPTADFVTQHRLPQLSLREFNGATPLSPTPPLSMLELENELYKDDGKALQRLREILRSVSRSSTVSP